MFLDKLINRSAVIGVIGLGYVGLPLVRELCSAGFTVIGFDIDKAKVDMLLGGKSYIKHIDSTLIKGLVERKAFDATNDFSRLATVDAIIICVPTPLNKHREPDLSYIFDTAHIITKYLKKGQLIILESTTYPGTTDEDMRKILEKGGMVAGKDFLLAFSPEREDPNNKNFNTRTIPKIVGGYSASCLEAANALYSCIVDRTIPVSSTRVAEATKLLENIFRSVNIALVNEMKMVFDEMGIDVWEVIAAAATKPFGFMPFYPGPGLGGHCIPIDPFYLTWKAREYEFSTRFIELAGEINIMMPSYVVQKTVNALNAKGKSLKGAKLLILGLAYKKDVDDMRESPSLKLIDLFQKKEALVSYNDPYIEQIPSTRRHNDLSMKSVNLDSKTLLEYDVIVISTDHSCYDYDLIRRHATIIIDTRNAMKATLNDPVVVKA